MTIVTVYHSNRDIIPEANSSLHEMLGRGHVLSIHDNKQTLTQLVDQEGGGQASVSQETNTPRFLIAWEGRRNRAPSLHEANEIEWEHTGLEYETLFKSENTHTDSDEGEERHVLYRLEGSEENLISTNTYIDEDDFFENYSEAEEGNVTFVSMLSAEYTGEEETEEEEDGTGGTDIAMETAKTSEAILQHHSAHTPTV